MLRLFWSFGTGIKTDYRYNNEMTEILQRVAAKAVMVNDEGKVLILREASSYDEGTNIGRYGLPGGRINPGELFMDGLRREIAEECGLRLEPIMPLYVGEWFPVIKGVTHHITAIFFACRAVTSDVTLSEEHDEFRWIDPVEHAGYDLMGPDNAVIQAWLDSDRRV